MDIMDELLIQQYFKLEKKLYKLKYRLENERRVFYQQSMNTHVSYTAQGLVPVGFRPDKEIITLYEQIDLIERSIERNSYRLKHFKAYLACLPKTDVRCFKAKYIEDKVVSISEEKCSSLLSEICEIETAICFRERLEPEPEQVTLSGDVLNDVATMAEVFAL